MALKQTSARLPEELRARIDEACAREGVSLSMWLCLAAEQRLAGGMRQDVIRRLDTLERQVADLRKRPSRP